jgi:hypothetical protein
MSIESRPAQGANSIALASTTIFSYKLSQQAQEIAWACFSLWHQVSASPEQCKCLASTAKQKVTQIINCVRNNKKYIIYDNTTFYDKGDIEVYWKVGSIIHYYGLLLRLPGLPPFLGRFVHPLFNTSTCCSAIDCIHDFIANDWLVHPTVRVAIVHQLSRIHLHGSQMPCCWPPCNTNSNLFCRCDMALFFMTGCQSFQSRFCSPLLFDLMFLNAKPCLALGNCHALNIIRDRKMSKSDYYVTLCNIFVFILWHVWQFDIFFFSPKLGLKNQKHCCKFAQCRQR